MFSSGAPCNLEPCHVYDFGTSLVQDGRMESSVSDSQWYCGNKCTVVDMDSGYDGHALSIVDRS